MDDKLLSTQEKKKYEKMWDVPSYRHTSPGYICLEILFDHFGKEIESGQSITDFGCGMGLTTMTFLEKGLKVQLVDIATNCLQDKIEALLLLASDKVSFTQASLWDLPKSLPPTDWIYCVDVLEHIPTEKVDDCLIHMKNRCLKGGVLQVFLIDEPYGDLIEEKLHLTIKPLEWWKEKISKYFHIDAIAPIIEDVRISFFIRNKAL